MRLDKNFKEFIELLNSLKVKYLLIGGWSVSIHAKPRYTKDIDFLILASEENAIKLLHVLNKFGFSSLEISKDDFLKKGQIVQLGVAPNRIDLITGTKGITFEKAWSNKVEIDIDGVLVNVISAEDLILNKKATARPQDLIDAENIRKMLSSKNSI